MKLYVMRHSIAEDGSVDGTDGARALTREGRDRAREVARALVALEEAPKVVVSSPLVRALQTAEIVHAYVSVELPLRIDGAIAPGGDLLAMVLAAARAGKKRMMVVGHEPDMSGLVARLVGAPPHPGFGKAMVVGLRIPVDGDRAQLRFVMDPKSCALTVDRRALAR
jgi:phosphohistidine phosphatase